MKILVLGKEGQLGRCIKDAADGQNGVPAHYLFADKADFDLAQPDATEKYIREASPDIVVNGAGYTAVDQAENDQENAFWLNGYMTGFLAELSAKMNFLLIHISTDYVFDGKNHRPYEEDDSPCAPSVYGQSKIMGEEHIFTAATRAVIIRTSWLYSPYGKNFVKTMLRLGKEKDEIGVVLDQVGTPTNAHDLAHAIMAILRNQQQITTPTIYHYSNEGAISWYDFAKAIMELSQLKCVVNPLESHQFPAKAPRPFYSVLNKSRIKNDFKLAIPYWRDSLKKNLPMHR